MKSLNRTLAVFIIFGVFTLLAGCGDTWDGLKKDTSENMQKTGSAISSAGKKLKSN